jgi:hypothetical protein
MAKIQLPNKREDQIGNAKEYSTQTVGGVTICVMFLAFCLWQLFGHWLLAFSERDFSFP